MKIVKRLIVSRGIIPLLILVGVKLMMVLTDFLSKDMIIGSIDSVSKKLILTAVIGLGTVVLLKVIDGILESIFYTVYHKSLTKGIEMLMKDLYNKYLNISYSDDIGLSSGSMVNIINDNMSKVADFVGGLIPALIEHLVKLISLVVFVCSMAPVLLIYTIIMGVIYIS